MRTDLRLAWLLVRGSDRREWWRIALTAAGAMCATGLGLAAAVLASVHGQYRFSFGNGLLDHPGERSGVIVTLLLLLVPVLGFLGQCARIGAVHRDRRTAVLRLAGAEPGRVRRIAALETGLACLLGSALATAGAVAVLVAVSERPTASAWAGMALVAVLVPALGMAAGVLALRRVVASPLGWVRRSPTRSGRGPALLVVGVVALGAVAGTSADSRNAGLARGPVIVMAGVLAVGAGAVWLTGVLSRLTGRLLAARTGSPAVLIAAERLRDDPWAAARTHAAVLLVTVVGAGYLGVRQALLAWLEAADDTHGFAEDASYYTTGLDLTAAAIVLALVITLAALAVGTAESVATRRRALAAQVAAGVPRRVLARALLLETALPLAPAVLVAGAGGLAIGVWYGLVAAGTVPYTALLVPAGVYGACLLAAAASLPLLRRSVRPAELRYA
ncbi:MULTISPECIES: ABC transporter permease [unclassified Streptomyces]|uniref:ABC transporter permease n=1 Tax=unclassified Streptomyces TaxID=2593676 RepID=UPI001CD3A0F9|nr:MULTISPECIES: ABC transporter permease [unclassified Streptomyces]